MRSVPVFSFALAVSHICLMCKIWASSLCRCLRGVSRSLPCCLPAMPLLLHTLDGHRWLCRMAMSHALMDAYVLWPRGWLCLVAMSHGYVLWLCLLPSCLRALITIAHPYINTHIAHPYINTHMQIPTHTCRRFHKPIHIHTHTHTLP